jgi:hypothetical protein
LSPASLVAGRDWSGRKCAHRAGLVDDGGWHMRCTGARHQPATTEKTMKPFKTMSLVLVLAFASAAAGCAGQEPGPGDDDGGDDTSGDDQPPGDDDVGYTTPTGKYAVRSEFDLATNLPGTVGAIVNGLIDATDGPDDPGRWLCDTAADQLSSGTLQDLAHAACAVAGGYINDQLLAIAPDFVDTIIDLAADFGQIAKQFGLDSELEVAIQSDAFVGTHTVKAINFRLDEQDNVFALADYGMGEVEAAGLGMTWAETGRLGIGAHDIPLSYGAILRIGLDELLIPRIDPLATDLADMLLGLVDCDAVGAAMADAIGFGSSGTYASACESGLEAGAGLIYSQIDGLEGTVIQFGLSGGEARAADTNGDYKVDELTRGEWAGTTSVGGLEAPLSDATFAGSRM